MAASASLLITIPEAAAQLEVSERHLRNCITRGQIRAVRIGRCVRVERAAVEAIVRDGLAARSDEGKR